ncbi:MAG: peptide synthase, partial [Chloroflexota bacterium]|nr:peptide synthase [Chloroflexota bacterium]
GYLDDDGRLWFYGRKSHRVQLADCCLYTEPCELVFNQHPAVYRSALIGVRSRDGANQPVIVVELEAGKQPRTEAERTRLIGELLELGARAPITAAIRTVLFHPSFPVDIRHNAKIFREKLAVWAQAQLRHSSPSKLC